MLPKIEESGDRWWRIEHESSECEGKRYTGCDIICKAYIPTKTVPLNERLSDGSTGLLDLYYCLTNNWAWPFWYWNLSLSNLDYLLT